MNATAAGASPAAGPGTAAAGPGTAMAGLSAVMPGDVGHVFAALADPMRRRLLGLLGNQAPASATALAGQLPVTRQAVVKHLAVLQKSDLIARRRDGREVVFTVRPDRLVDAASWMTSLAASWQERLQVLKQVAEAAPPGPAGVMQR